MGEGEGEAVFACRCQLNDPQDVCSQVVCCFCQDDADEEEDTWSEDENEGAAGREAIAQRLESLLTSSPAQVGPQRLLVNWLRNTAARAGATQLDLLAQPCVSFSPGALSMCRGTRAPWAP